MRIGLTYTGSDEKHVNYINWLKGESNIEIVRLSVKDDNLDELKNCDGLVLSGGVDIHPRFYGSDKIDYDGRPDEFKEKRDLFEIDALKIADERKLPVLGICRGLQLINCIYGGTLKQDLMELNSVHTGIPENKDNNHFVRIEPNTLLFSITNADRGKVNSSHHQAIDKLGKGLRVNCKADDGIIEGIERSDVNQPFLLAVQWHPERMVKMQLQEAPLSKNIRDNFLEAAKSRQTAC